ncbi:MAG TPA: pirin family protein [Leptospiraceae bacterium]|nr:pirin family protein [Leptospiraceae bacterium]
MKKRLHLREERGHSDFGWLDSWHSFSFGHWFHPKKMGFGKLRVLNDDTVAPESGFGTHPHENMEIISIPIEGKISHKDSSGGKGTIEPGEIQVMSAGTGITHSEYNLSKNERLKFLQIWILPKKMNVKPRYEQRLFLKDDFKNRIRTVVFPESHSDELNICQDAYISIGDMEETQEIIYKKYSGKNGVFLFVISGQAEIDGQTLREKDAVELTEENSYSVRAEKNSKLLFIEVPL